MERRPSVEFQDQNWERSLERFAHLNPWEVVALSGVAYGYDAEGNDTDTARSDVLAEDDFGFFLSAVTEAGGKRARDIHTAFISSANFRDRLMGCYLNSMLRNVSDCHDTAVELCCQFLLDPHPDVRHAAVEQLEDELSETLPHEHSSRFTDATPGPGVLSTDALAVISDEALREAGFSRREVHLYISAADRAEVGEVFDLAQAALEKLRQTQHPLSVGEQGSSSDLGQSV